MASPWSLPTSFSKTALGSKIAFFDDIAGEQTATACIAPRRKDDRPPDSQVVQARRERRRAPEHWIFEGQRSAWHARSGVLGVDLLCVPVT